MQTASRSLARRAAVSLALLLLPSVAYAAVTLKGRVTGAQKLINPVWSDAAKPDSNRYTFREPSATVRQDVFTLSSNVTKEVCVVALAEQGAPLKVPLRVVVAGGRTSPVTLVVAVGQQVLFENHDPFNHKLYDVGKKGFGPTEMAMGKSQTWTPPGPGKYEIRDLISPSIRSWIVVEPQTVAVGYPDKKGEFAIDLDPGKYRLRAYYNGEPVSAELEALVLPRGQEQLLRGELKLEPPAAPPPAPPGDKK